MIRGLIVVVETLLWLLVLRFVLRAIASVFAGASRPAASAPRERPAVRAAEDLVLDRVCHTYVPRSRALSARVAGHDEAFCSAACRDQALAAVTRAS